MAPPVKYTADRRGTGALAQSPGVQAATLAAAQAVKAEAERRAATFARSGTYRDSFVARPTTVKAGRLDEPRAGAEVYNDAKHGNIVEVGGNEARPNYKARHVLRDSAAAVAARNGGGE